MSGKLIAVSSYQQTFIVYCVTGCFLSLPEVITSHYQKYADVSQHYQTFLGINRRFLVLADVFKHYQMFLGINRRFLVLADVSRYQPDVSWHYQMFLVKSIRFSVTVRGLLMILFFPTHKIFVLTARVTDKTQTSSLNRAKWGSWVHMPSMMRSASSPYRQCRVFGSQSGCDRAQRIQSIILCSPSPGV